MIYKLELLCNNRFAVLSGKKGIKIYSTLAPYNKIAFIRNNETDEF